MGPIRQCEHATFAIHNGQCTWQTITSASACTLPHDSTYCAVVRAKNAHGLWGARAKSNGIKVCSLGPIAGKVSDGVSALYDGVELDYMQWTAASSGSQSAVSLSWEGFSDSCAPLDHYEVSLQSPDSGDAWATRHHRRQSTSEQASTSGYAASQQERSSVGPLCIGTTPHAWSKATEVATVSTGTSATVLVPSAALYTQHCP